MAMAFEIENPTADDENGALVKKPCTGSETQAGFRVLGCCGSSGNRGLGCNL